MSSTLGRIRRRLAGVVRKDMKGDFQLGLLSDAMRAQLGAPKRAVQLLVKVPDGKPLVVSYDEDQRADVAAGFRLLGDLIAGGGK